MVDIHNHILPEIDDGAQTLNMALEMAYAAIKDGVTAIITTPHYEKNKYPNERSIVEAKVMLLNEQLQKNNIPLTVYPGQEVRIFGDLVDEYEQRKIITLNHSHYMLIEFPHNDIPVYAEKLFYNLQLANIKPIIAHPERNQKIAEDPNILFQFIANGALAQLTAASLIGMFGKKIMKLSHRLIDANLVHFIASDAHNASSRKSCFLEAYQLLEDTFGSELNTYFQENAENLLTGKIVFNSPPQQIKKAVFFNFF